VDLRNYLAKSTGMIVHDGETTTTRIFSQPWAVYLVELDLEAFGFALCGISNTTISAMARPTCRYPRSRPMFPEPSSGKRLIRISSGFY